MSSSTEPSHTLNAIFFAPPIDNKFLGHIMAEIFKERLYDPYFEGKSDLTVLDIGANVGVFTYYAAPFSKRIISVEPAAEHFAALEKMVEFNGLTDKVTPIKAALSHESGTSRLSTVAQNATMNSLTPGLPATGSEEVKTITIEQLLTEQAIDRVDILKLDVEGAEPGIIGGEAFKNVCERIDTIVGEFHSWTNMNPELFANTLRDRGYEFQWLQAEAAVFVARRMR